MPRLAGGAAFVRRVHGAPLPHPLGLRPRGHRPVIAQAIGCSPQAVRNVLRGFETRGLAVVAMQSRRPHTAANVFDAQRSERLKALLHQSPRQFGKARSTWTLALAAEVCAEHGITAERVSYE